MITVKQVKMKVGLPLDILEAVSKKLHLAKDEIKKIEILKESIDARDKNNIFYCYELAVLLKNEKEYLKRKHLKDVSLFKEFHYQFPKVGEKELLFPPIIVGSGPCGLFTAYLLAENGYKPIVLEQGDEVKKRKLKVEEFFKVGKLDPLTNVSFGEGGAGLFSDGKIGTMVKDREGRGKKVFEVFCENGAPKEILYKNNPHIGTDVLENVIINMRNKIIAWGGKFCYNSKLTDLKIENNQIVGVEVNNRSILPCEVLILAIGHSARDTFYLLHERGLKMESKPFALGVRIEHLQEDINDAQYASYKDLLPPASYKLTYQTANKRGVYSFCMCPGGYVINSSSEEGLLNINGMSYHARNSKNANSAIIVTVSEKDYGKGLFGGMKFQEELERKAYEIGKGRIPVCRFKDFKQGVCTNYFGKVKPLMKGGYHYAPVYQIYPKTIRNSLIEAIEEFGKKIKGFNDPDSLISGVESRTSSPVRILRDEKYEASVNGIYPGGEGAGYAGGITTSAIDGVKIAEAIGKLYKN